MGHKILPAVFSEGHFSPFHKIFGKLDIIAVQGHFQGIDSALSIGLIGSLVMILSGVGELLECS